jgi:hypothetical protein
MGDYTYYHVHLLTCKTLPKLFNSLGIQMHSKYQKTLALILLFIGYSTLGAQTLEWVRQLGSPQGHVYTTDYTSDNSGNFYRVGAFTDQVDFDLGPGTAVLTAVGKLEEFHPKTGCKWQSPLGGRFADPLAVPSACRSQWRPAHHGLLFGCNGCRSGARNREFSSRPTQ